MGPRTALTVAACRRAALVVSLVAASCATRGGVGRFEVRADVTEAPRVVPVPGGRLAVWELEVRNGGESPVRVERLVMRRSDRTGDATVSGDALSRRIVPRRREADPARRLELGPGERLVVLLDAALGGGLPAIECDLDVSGPGERGSTVRETVTASDRTPDESPPVVLAPPLRGDSWLFENGPETLSGHRRAVVWLSHRPRAAQRFSGDFFRVDAGGRTFSGPPGRNEGHFAFGADVLAVADAIVAAAVDGIPDNVPHLFDRAVGMSNDTVAGNHVVLDLGGGRFAMYAHLRNGSVRVRAGDRVTAGDVLGALGNSGNSTEPHLHFHVADGPSPVDASGLPFVFAAFTAGGAQFSGVLPAEGSVVGFGGRIQATTGVPTDDAAR